MQLIIFTCGSKIYDPYFYYGATAFVFVKQQQLAFDRYLYIIVTQ